MPRFLRIVFTLICALYLSGAHWMVLQTAAWAGMIMTRTEQVGVVAAVETTFSGEKPCAFCKAISEGQKEEKEKVPEAPALKKLLETKVVAVANRDWPAPEVSGEMVWPKFWNATGERAEAPLTPPPRG